MNQVQIWSIRGSQGESAQPTNSKAARNKVCNGSGAQGIHWRHDSHHKIPGRPSKGPSYMTSTQAAVTWTETEAFQVWLNGAWQRQDCAQSTFHLAEGDTQCITEAPIKFLGQIVTKNQTLTKRTASTNLNSKTSSRHLSIRIWLLWSLSGSTHCPSVKREEQLATEWSTFNSHLVLWS